MPSLQSSADIASPRMRLRKPCSNCIFLARQMSPESFFVEQCRLTFTKTRKLVSMIKLIPSIAFATPLMGSVAFAQTSTSSTKVATQPNGMTPTTTTTTESFGTVTEFTPGDSLILKTEATEPMHYT